MLSSALIVTGTAKSAEFFSLMLNAAFIKRITTCYTGGEARRLMLERDFDLVIINAPLIDESGENLARHIAAKGVSQALLIVKSQHFEAITAACEDYGVLVVAKPLNKDVFWAALKLAAASHSSLRRKREENYRLQQKIENIRYIDKAKCLLISCLNMDEQEAHRYIEKQAMNMRTTKRAIAEGIVKTYEN